MQHPSKPTTSPERDVPRTVRPTGHLFTSTPVHSPFRTPIFQSERSEKMVPQEANSLDKKHKVVSVFPVEPKHQTSHAPDSNENDPPAERRQLPVSTSKQDTSGTDLEDTEEEEQSIFYSPELFEGNDEEKEETAATEVEKSPLNTQVDDHPTNSKAEVFSEELFGSKQVKRTLSKDLVSSAVPDDALLQVNSEQADSSSTEFENGPSLQKSSSSSRSRRLSRSRQKRLSMPGTSGKLTSYFKCVPTANQPCIVTVDD